jgi:4a-hydroxytetrahydrobiopterin dehydratase
VPGWRLTEDGRGLKRRFRFPSFQHLVAFLNALAWIAIRQGHHPDFTARHYDCTVNWTTHAIGGLSENDFICAARLSASCAGSPSEHGA